MATPNSIKAHADKYKEDAWRNYTQFELAAFVTLLRKRAEHRTDEAKKEKDIQDASNYRDMLIAGFEEGTFKSPLSADATAAEQADDEIYFTGEHLLA